MPNSPWTETGNSISLVSTASTIDGGTTANSVSYLSNADKISLMSQYASELATKTQLDTQAGNLSISGAVLTNYDAAVAAINTTLIAAGAPENWATIWPDGTTSGPWANIKTSLTNCWAAIATARTALQAGISAAQAAVAQAAAISAAALDATSKTNAAILSSQPHKVAWAYSAKPALPSNDYPAGYYAITSDSRTVQVSSDGKTWNDVLVATTGLFGQITAAQIILQGKSLIADDTFALGSIGWSGFVQRQLSSSSAVPSGCPASSAAQFNRRDNMYQQTINVVAGEQYLVTAYGHNNGGSGGGGIGLVCYQEDSSGTIMEAYAFAESTASGWTKLQGVLTVNSGRSGIMVGVWVDYSTFVNGANGSPWFAEFTIEKMADASMIVDGTITTQKLNANAIQTSNYAETSGNPTAGAKMDISSIALKVAAGSFQLGNTIFADYLLPRIVQALDGNASGGLVWYRGNIDNTIRGGAPNINCLTIQPRFFEYSQNATHYGFWSYKIIPTSYAAGSDNLDALRELRIRLYQYLTSAAPFLDLNVQITDRMYAGTSTTGGTGGTFFLGWRPGYDGSPAVNMSLGSLPYLYGGYIRATIYNSYGGSADVDFGPSNTPGANLPTTTITGQTGSTTGTGGGSGGGGCPAPWVPITLASGLVVSAGNLYDGAEVAGIDESTHVPAVGVVRSPQRIWSKRIPIMFEDGRAPEFSLDHRLLTDAGWSAVRDLKPGMQVLGTQVGTVKVLGDVKIAEVITFTVDRCHTYISDGFISHNNKMVPQTGL